MNLDDKKKLKSSENISDNSSGPTNNITFKDFLKELILSNFISMLKRKDTNSIYELLNNDDKMKSLLCSFGDIDGLANKPAHMVQLVACMKEMLSYLLNAMRDDDYGYKVEVEDNGLSIDVEDCFKERKYKLMLNSESYEFDLTSNIGEVKRKIKGKSSIIATFSKYYDVNMDKQVLSKMILDEHGFVIEQTTEEVSEKKAKGVKTLRRDGVKIISNSNQISSWNGQPFELNKKSASPSEFSNNMYRTIAKYPDTREYYESIIGKNLVNEIMKIYEQRQKS